jgi:hypothetical protein
MPEEEDWGEPIYVYTDEQAIEDGVLIPFRVREKDTGHRITGTLYEALKRHYKEYEYDDAQYGQFFLNELLPLVPYALRQWHEGGILQTDYDFRVRAGEDEGRIWYVPNGRGVTMMRPGDY